MNVTLTLNDQACRLADALVARAEQLRMAVHTVAGARVLDLGVSALGGLAAGLALARLCLADRGEVALVSGPQVQVYSDDPARACMASQYAGWQIKAGKFFAMGSGPMRAAYGKEPLFDRIGNRERPPRALGVLETGKLPPEEAVAYVAERVQLPPDQLTLACASTRSLAGTVQVVARSLETALHK